jgi:hypothetical protein
MMIISLRRRLCSSLFPRSGIFLDITPPGEPFLKGLNILPNKAENGNNDLGLNGDGRNQDLQEGNPVPGSWTSSRGTGFPLFSLRNYG